MLKVGREGGYGIWLKDPDNSKSGRNISFKMVTCLSALHCLARKGMCRSSKGRNSHLPSSGLAHIVTSPSNDAF